MKKIKDERLKLQNLKNIRIAFFIQSTGIIGILLYDIVQNGYDEMIGNPLWFVLILTMVVYLYLSMSISIDHESEEKSAKKGLIVSLIVLMIISVLMTVFVALTDGFYLLDGAILGAIIFVSGLIPIIYIYRLRKKRTEDSKDR